MSRRLTLTIREIKRKQTNWLSTNHHCCVLSNDRYNGGRYLTILNHDPKISPSFSVGVKYFS